jgi:hypothetical protein
MCLTGTWPKLTVQLLPPCPGSGLTIELQNRTTIGRTTVGSGLSHGLGSWVQWVPELHRFSLSRLVSHGLRVCDGRGREREGRTGRERWGRDLVCGRRKEEEKKRKGRRRREACGRGRVNWGEKRRNEEERKKWKGERTRVRLRDKGQLSSPSQSRANTWQVGICIIILKLIL